MITSTQNAGNGTSRRLYVATSDEATNDATAAVPGVYRFDGSNVVAPDGTYTTPYWLNLTDTATQTRKTQAGAPNSAGPDDDFRIRFPQAAATWSDLSLVYANPGNGDTVPVLYAALGTYTGSFANAIYRTVDPEFAAPATTSTLTGVVPIAATPPDWLIGAPAATNEVQTITVDSCRQSGDYQVHAVVQGRYYHGDDRPRHDRVGPGTGHPERAEFAADDLHLRRGRLRDRSLRRRRVL